MTFEKKSDFEEMSLQRKWRDISHMKKLSIDGKALRILKKQNESRINLKARCMR